MSTNTKGPHPPSATPSVTNPTSPTSRGESTHTTDGVSESSHPLDLPEYSTLDVLGPRLIPLCKPTPDGGCSCPSHNRKDKCNAPGKRPIERNWADYGHQSRWPKYPYNVGIRCGGGVAVVDVDPRNGGTELLAALEAAYGRLPDAPESLTGGGGRHLFYHARTEQTSWKLQGVELKAMGSQVVAPGSLHPSGIKYAWAEAHTPQHFNTLPELPEWLTNPPEMKEPRLKAVPKPAEPDPRKDVWDGETLRWEEEEYPLEEIRKRATAYIESMPEAVSGQGGHEIAFRCAVALVRGFLLPEREARNLYRLWNKQRCKPAWGVGELEHKLAEASSRVRSDKWPWGYLIKNEPQWPDLAPPAPKEETAEDVDDGQDKPQGRTIENRMVYVSAHDKFMWFEEGVDKPGLVNWQSHFSENGARGMLQSAGYGFKKASVYVKEKRCHIVKDFSGLVPTNERIVKGTDGKLYLNLPQQLIPTPVPGPTPLLDELMHAIAGGDSEATEWLWNWSAYIVQNRNDLPGVCVVVRGPHGVGKTKLGEAIGYCRGAYVAVGNSIFREQFNSKWSPAHFVNASEVMLADSRKEHNDRFKAWITDPFIEYHKKNVPEFNIPNRIAWWLTSNDDNPVIVPRGDRRFTVLESVALGADVKEKLVAAWAQYNRCEHEWPELQAFHHKLLNYTVDVKKARSPLHNAVHDEHEEASKSSVELFTDALKRDGWRPLVHKYGAAGWGVESQEGMKRNTIGVDGAFIYKIYQQWTKDRGLYSLGFPRFASASVMRTTFHKLPQRRIHGIQYRLWVLPMGVDPDGETS